MPFPWPMRLKGNDLTVIEVARFICESFIPRNFYSMSCEEQINQLEEIVENVTAQLFRLKKQDKAREFRNHPSELDDTFLAQSDDYICVQPRFY